ncbi:MAG: hypothetical protein ACRCT8_10185 [Lacipirellulaceae bacterium]
MLRLVVALCSALCLEATAQCPYGCDLVGASYADAARAYEIAATQQRLYQRGDHPGRVRALTIEKQIAEARIQVLRRRLAELRPINRFTTGNALLVTAEETRIALLREELHLRGLRDALLAEQRWHSERMREMVLATQHAAAHLAQHPAGDPTEPIVITVER